MAHAHFRKSLKYKNTCFHFVLKKGLLFFHNPTDDPARGKLANITNNKYKKKKTDAVALLPVNYFIKLALDSKIHHDIGYAFHSASVCTRTSMLLHWTTSGVFYL